MKTKIVTVIMFFATFYIFSQEKVNFDLLQAPNSPAFNLLGISPNNIDKPTDLTSFAVSLQNASSNFSQLPSDFAMEFAPFLIFEKTSNTIEDLQSTEFPEVFKQTFLISVGLTNELDDDDKPKLSRLGTGFKFSIIRPKFDSITNINLGEIYKDQYNLNLDRKALQDNDSNYKFLKKQSDNIQKEMIKDGISDERLYELEVQYKKIDKLLTDRIVELKPIRNDSIRNSLSEKAKVFKINRKSTFFLDLAGGVVTDFTEQTFNRSELTKGGLWLTGGFENCHSFSFLGVGRYLYQPDKLFADDSGTILKDDLSSFDAGLRIIYKEPKKEKLSISLEGIYRSVNNKDIVAPSLRAVITTSYDVGNNQMLTFSFGKDFDNTYIKDNNLIAALNFIIGLGGIKEVK